MNQDIETILHKAPQPKAPGGLAEKLRADITLPRASADEAPSTAREPFVRRWLPALSFAAFLLACLVAIAVQANVLADLRRQNRELQLSVGEAEQQRASRHASQNAQTEQLRLEQLRKDVAEVERLRQELAELAVASQELAGLRAENQRLRAAAQAANQTGAGAEQDPFGAAKAKAESTQCISNLKQVGLAARIWSNDHGDVLPPDILSMQKELNSPKILVCPSDSGKTRASSWAEYGPANLSYEFLAFGVSERETPYTVMTRCPVHDHVGLLDGSVQGGGWKRAVQKDGRWVIENNASRR